LEFGDAVFFVGGGKPENPEENPRSMARTNNKLISGSNWWEARALTTAPSPFPKNYLRY